MPMSRFESSQGISMTAWVLAASCTIAIHVAGIALVCEYVRYDEPDAELGALAIEIGLEPLAPRIEPIDLPPGLDAEERVPTPTTIEQVRIEPDVLPPVPPTETEDPELAVTPVKIEEPKNVPSPPAPLPVTLTAPTEASKAMARPSSEIARESARSATPAQGVGDSTQRVLAAWQKELIAHFNQHKRYPANRSLDSVEILVNFVLDESGRVLSSGIVRGAGDAAFDKAALAMIRSSDPVPKPPPFIVQQGLSFTLPVIFRLNTR
jgi:periplasmic protein TonB